MEMLFRLQFKTYLFTTTVLNIEIIHKPLFKKLQKYFFSIIPQNRKPMAKEFKSKIGFNLKRNLTR